MFPARFDWGANRQEGVTRLSVAQTFTPMQRDVFAFSTGPRGMRIYRNGRLIASNTANPQRTSNTQVVTLNTQYGGSGDLSNYESVLIWWEQLSDADAMALTLNPYQIFDVPMRRPAGVLSGMSGSAVLSLSASGTLDFGPIILAGSAALALSVNAALTTAITMQGAAALALQTDPAALFAGKKAMRLKKCGHPLSTACEDWLLADD